MYEKKMDWTAFISSDGNNSFYRMWNIDNGGNDTADAKDESTSSDSNDSEKIVLEFFNQKVEAEVYTMM